jgi:hypothetical protein
VNVDTGGPIIACTEPLTSSDDSAPNGCQTDEQSRGYFLNCAEAERKAAMSASSRKAADIHRNLARKYAEIAG